MALWLLKTLEPGVCCFLCTIYASTSQGLRLMLAGLDHKQGVCGFRSDNLQHFKNPLSSPAHAVPLTFTPARRHTAAQALNSRPKRGKPSNTRVNTMVSMKSANANAGTVAIGRLITTPDPYISGCSNGHSPQVRRRPLEDETLLGSPGSQPHNQSHRNMRALELWKKKRRSIGE